MNENVVVHRLREVAKRGDAERMLRPQGAGATW